MNGQQPLDGYLHLHGKANDKITPATFKLGVISNINLQSWTADVQIIGNQATVLKGVQLATTISLGSIKIGDKCRVDMFSEINPNDMIVAYIYGRKPNSLANSASVTLTMTNGTQYKIAHGLGVVPNIYGLTGETYPQGVSPVANIATVFLDPSQVPDASYLYIKSSSASSATMNFVWFAAYVS